MTELQKLNAFARAETAVALTRGFFIWPIFPLLWVWDDFGQRPGHREVAVMWVLTGMAIAAALLLWTRYRHALLAGAAVMACMCVFFLWFSIKYSHRLGIVRWVALVFCGLACAQGTFELWRWGRRLLAVPRTGWEPEERQFGTWRRLLEDDNPDPNVVEFSGASFWTGLYRLRILSAGEYCVLARFVHRGRKFRRDFQVFDSGDVEIVSHPDGLFVVRAGGRHYRKLEPLVGHPPSQHA